ncbi:hypothetical protein CDD81_5747 [Ophiocordyceps australis]|uniref:DUF7704 domain-containing protein n=1 Tax=Ophiocordyceps australis TaxID=1399860 RepID=A0A2C5Y7Z2_9HYPO|nr:hypothetical protein CDD81_5747 [Ophiocordyceps australis]
MASSLPTVPRVVFTILEPLSLVAASVFAINDPAWFVAEQIPHTAPSPAPQTLADASIVMARQLGNMYLLMALVGLAVLLSTREPCVVRSYLFALWLGDVGHIAFSCYGLGWERVMNPWQWNAMAWGNLFVTALLFTLRSAYFVGLFGPDRLPVTGAKKRG